ncbi:MAG: xanthine dehydrogenase family protein molybdopterin-binding subunit [Alphaproteobacteria bacterium]|nr:xanthine dehydrogenase family protein molybdopterin-binding subunit [Alphaproteobacteria bacterium]MBU1517222.1 xanthine dehydrogenase family protein molybdopterin-binding subunit [Alphaproteobacteria bacterium]MBU2093242.1 xanthine dehydrogenase family protein molybdopterin-binding subunit [Alphaproteobacteria bacterium]MBU2153132.1 xanthine dehydrogenase family protein molybdopterin-binding subunit [Alphaproteobacteria bacterium]MBU2307838.1 xanthine dehydrogenase family protein molybdopte
MNKPLKNIVAAASRREVLVVGATLAGASLLVGCSLPDALSAGSKIEVGAFGPFLKFSPDGTVTVISKHIEFGQGNHAGLAAIAAEELDADWDKVKVEQAAASAKLYGNAIMGGTQGTGGSSAIANSWTQLRTAGAAARAMFVSAAATKWGVPAGEITVANGVIAHASGKQAGFGDLVAEAAKVAPPTAPKLKDPKTFTLIGTDRVRRKDAQAKSNGTARYTQDVRLPDMLVAMVAHAPKFGAKVKSFDATEAKKIAGVTAVYEIPTGVAVVANSTWAAKQGRDALKVEWDEAKAEQRGSAQILAAFKDLASGKTAAPDDKKTGWKSFESKGDAAKAAAGTAAVEVAYDFPYLAHATMEPMNCVAMVGKGPTRLVFGSQTPTLDQINTAGIVLALPGSIEIETLFAGGSFGRRANFQSDYVTECVHIAKKVGKGRPVKLVWTREDDMRAGYYRPLVHHTVRVTTDADGYPATWKHRVVTQSIMKGAPPGSPGGGGVDATAVEGALGSPYLKATPIVDAQLITPDAGVPVLWWRSVGATHTAYVMEHTVDQLAKKAGKDPVEYRRALYQKAGAARHLAVLNLAAEKAGWTTPATDGWTRGVAVHESFGSVVAQVAEVKMENGQPKVGRVVTAVDCGTAISPDQIAAQMEGGTCYGLSAALFGNITLTGGVVDQQNFDTYRVLRNSEAPTVETYIVASANPPSGVGEPGTPVIGPAVANALLAITGQPTLSQPFVKA